MHLHEHVFEFKNFPIKFKKFQLSSLRLQFLVILKIVQIVAFFVNFKVRATAKGEGQHFRWRTWNTGISSRLPSLQLLLLMFTRKDWRKLGQKSLPNSPIDWSLISQFPTTPPPSQLQLSVLNMWLLQACCSLLFTIINHNQVIYLMTTMKIALSRVSAFLPNVL